jgi:hypothetical protein
MVDALEITTYAPRQTLSGKEGEARMAEKPTVTVTERGSISGFRPDPRQRPQLDAHLGENLK